jgi:hypothetical protein
MDQNRAKQKRTRQAGKADLLLVGIFFVLLLFVQSAIILRTGASHRAVSAPAAVENQERQQFASSVR